MKNYLIFLLGLLLAQSIIESFGWLIYEALREYVVNNRKTELSEIFDFYYIFLRFTITIFPYIILFAILYNFVIKNSTYFKIAIIHFVLNVFIAWFFLYVIESGLTRIGVMINIVIISFLISLLIILIKPFSSFLVGARE